MFNENLWEIISQYIHRLYFIEIGEAVLAIKHNKQTDRVTFELLILVNIVLLFPSYPFTKILMKRLWIIFFTHFTTLTRIHFKYQIDWNYVIKTNMATDTIISKFRDIFVQRQRHPTDNARTQEGRPIYPLIKSTRVTRFPKWL